MDQLLEDAKIDIPPTSKQWEPYRAYEKRLSAIMSKDKREHSPSSTLPTSKSIVAHGTKSRKKKADKAGLSGASSGDETEGEKTANELEAHPARPKPRPKRATRANPVIAEDETGEPATAVVETVPGPTTPQRLRATSTPLSELPADAEEEDVEKTPTRASVAATAPVSTPMSVSRNKRPRGDEDAEDGDALPNGGASGHDSDVAGTPDIKVKRKRVRH